VNRYQIEEAARAVRSSTGCTHIITDTDRLHCNKCKEPTPMAYAFTYDEAVTICTALNHYDYAITHIEGA